jgi:hypothetical protein
MTYHIWDGAGTSEGRRLLGHHRCWQRRRRRRRQPGQVRERGVQIDELNKLVESLADRGRRPGDLRQNGLFLSAFPMFVPSLSWQKDCFYI